MYFDELKKAMALLAADERTIFIGQAISYPGQAAFDTFAGVPTGKRIELPVFENTQVGMSTGLSLAGFIPVSFFPRWDFLIAAADQLVNHLDKIAEVSDFRPKVIIRVGVGGTSPLDPGPQHTQNHTAAMRFMLKNIPLIDLQQADLIVSNYQLALSMPGSVIVVEHMSRYREKT